MSGRRSCIGDGAISAPVEHSRIELDHQQLLLLEVVGRAGGAPVSYQELRDAGVEYPASVVAELELAGVRLERSHGSGAPPRLLGVRLDPRDARRIGAFGGEADGGDTDERAGAERAGAGRRRSAHATIDGVDRDALAAALATARDALAAALATARDALAALAAAARAAHTWLTGQRGRWLASERRARPLPRRPEWLRRPSRAGGPADGATDRPSRPSGATATRWIAPIALVLTLAAVAALVIGAPGGVRPTRRTSAPRAGRPAAPAQRPRPTTAPEQPPTAAVPVSPALAERLEARGHSLLQAGELEAALPVLRRALAATGESLGGCLEPVSETCLTYAYALYDLGRALRLDRRAGDAVPILERRLQIANQRPVVASELQLARREAGSPGPSAAAPGSGRREGSPASAG